MFFDSLKLIMKSLEKIAAQSYLDLDAVRSIEETVLSTGYLSPEKARAEIDRFLNGLGIGVYYFENTSIDEIAKHLLAISASELASHYGGKGVGIQLINEQEDRAVYIVEEVSAKTEEIEKRIERKYPLFRLESYMTTEKSGASYLRLYTLTRPRFAGTAEPSTFDHAADRALFKRSETATVERYREAWQAMNNRQTPYIAISAKEETRETRVMIGVHSSRARDLLTNFSHLFYQYGIHSNRKYREIFGDNKKIYTFYFDKIDPRRIPEFRRDLTGVVMLPDNAITSLFLNELSSPHETLYAVSAAAFTNQFLIALSEE